MTVNGREIHSRKWGEFRKRVFALYGRVCWICGHGGANEVDHVIPKAVAPGLFWNMDNLRPAHGTSCRCPAGCGACNQARRRNPAPPPEPKPQPRTAPTAPQLCTKPGCDLPYPHYACTPGVSRKW